MLDLAKTLKDLAKLLLDLANILLDSRTILYLIRTVLWAHLKFGRFLWFFPASGRLRGGTGERAIRRATPPEHKPEAGSRDTRGLNFCASVLKGCQAQLAGLRL